MKERLVVERDRIDAYEETGRRFMSEILDMDWDGVILTDGCRLSDFSFCGMPEDLEIGPSLSSSYRAWDAWVIEKIESVFSVRLEKTTVSMIDVFDRIEKRPSLALRH
jgi:hypothetical protein